MNDGNSANRKRWKAYVDKIANLVSEESRVGTSSFNAGIRSREESELSGFAQWDSVRGFTHPVYKRLTCTGARENIDQDQHGAPRVRYAAADLRSSVSGSDTLSGQAVGLDGI